MRSYSKDILLNVVVPVAAGMMCYKVCQYYDGFLFTRNHLADGLWAYAFTSMMLIVWERHLQTTWLAAAFSLFISFELLQAKGIINGTGDLYDVLIYVAFGGLAILLNDFFTTLFKYTSKPLIYDKNC